MKITRKISAVITLLSMVITLCSCKADADPVEETTSASTEITTQSETVATDITTETATQTSAEATTEVTTAQTTTTEEKNIYELGDALIRNIFALNSKLEQLSLIGEQVNYVYPEFDVELIEEGVVYMSLIEEKPSEIAVIKAVDPESADEVALFFENRVIDGRMSDVNSYSTIWENAYYERKGNYIIFIAIPEEYITPFDAFSPDTPLPEELFPEVYSPSVYGTADYIDGKTLIASIFVNDEGTMWDWSRKEDCETREKALIALEDAALWLGDECEKYGASPEFIYNWKEHSELYKEASTFEKLVRMDGGGYYYEQEIVLNSFDIGGLLEEFDADNILFVLFFNTDSYNTERSVTFSSDITSLWSIEIVNIYFRSDGYEITGGTLAHEILHCFGANDLYYFNEDITEEYVSHMYDISSRDIMFNVNIYDGKAFLSEIDAYYIGLIPPCDEIRKWGLGPSERDE